MRFRLIGVAVKNLVRIRIHRRTMRTVEGEIRRLMTVATRDSEGILRLLKRVRVLLVSMERH